MAQTNSLSLLTDAQQEDGFPHILFKLADNVYAMSGEHVVSMELLREVTQVADSPDYVEGIIDFRGTVIPLLNLRTLFGLPSQKEEMESKINFKQRMKDHEIWVETLTESVRTRKPFTMTDDPHKCAFGKWFDSFKTDNNELALHLKRIDGPHQAVHETAKTVSVLMARGEYEAAADAVEEMRKTHFVKTLQLLSEINEAYERGLHEMLIVVHGAEQDCGVLVDNIISVEYLESVAPAPATIRSSYIQGIGRRRKEDGNVLVLNCEAIRTDLRF